MIPSGQNGLGACFAAVGERKTRRSVVVMSKVEQKSAENISQSSHRIGLMRRSELIVKLSLSRRRNLNDSKLCRVMSRGELHALRAPETLKEKT